MASDNHRLNDPKLTTRQDPIHPALLGNSQKVVMGHTHFILPSAEDLPGIGKARLRRRQNPEHR